MSIEIVLQSFSIAAILIDFKYLFSEPLKSPILMLTISILKFCEFDTYITIVRAKTVLEAAHSKQEFHQNMESCLLD